MLKTKKPNKLDKVLAKLPSICVPFHCPRSTKKSPIVGFSWTMKGSGFGEIVFYYKDGKLHCDNECMNRWEILARLYVMLQSCILDTKPFNKE